MKFKSNLCCVLRAEVKCLQCSEVICSGCFIAIERAVTERDIIPAKDDPCAVDGQVDNVGYHWWISVDHE